MAKKQFKSESKRLLDLMINSIYTHKEIFYFVRFISNAIHAVLIRESKEKDYVPELNLNVVFDEIQCKIELTDNGEGFNEKNRKYF
mgnify:CR=1 FL=1